MTVASFMAPFLCACALASALALQVHPPPPPLVIARHSAASG
jgi:hypothetical protein